jgi:hypothetical protein
MPLVSRATLGAEFFDITSQKLLLQPEPQYLYALLWKMALNASLQQSSGISFRGDIGQSGAPYSTAEGNRQGLFEDPIYTSAIHVVTELGNVPGHTVRLNRPKFTDTTYTQASREIAMGTSISTTPINIDSEQVSVTLKRFGGPYDQTNSRVAPFGVDRFDASRSVHSIAGAVGAQLTRDFDKTIDRFIGVLMGTASSTLYPSGYAATTDFADAGGDGPMSMKLLSRLETAMDVALLPTFADGYRCVVTSPLCIEQLKDDPQFARYSEFMPPVNPLLKAGYYKSVGRTHIFKSTTLPTTTNGGAGTLYETHAFAPGVIGSALGEMPRTATSTADNYGEWALVIWLAYMAFQNLDNRFCVKAFTN